MTKAQYLEARENPMPNSPFARRAPAFEVPERSPRDSTYYAFVKDGWKFCVLDTNYALDGTSFESIIYPPAEASINAEQLVWLRSELSDGLPSIVFAHANLDYRETDGKKDIHVITNDAEARVVLENAGNVKAVFQGHCHWGAFQAINKIPYITLHSVVVGKYPANGACAVVSVTGEAIDVEGFDNQGSYKIML